MSRAILRGETADSRRTPSDYHALREVVRELVEL